MSTLGVKAGERIRTADVQLGKRKARIGKASRGKWLRRALCAGAQLGAGRLARGGGWCHILTACDSYLAYAIIDNRCGVRNFGLVHRGVTDELR